MAIFIVVALFVAGIIDFLWLIEQFIFWILDDIWPEYINKLNSCFSLRPTKPARRR